ncbi:MAG: cation transporter [Jatrophihabitantaceae bacterium]
MKGSGDLPPVHPTSLEPVQTAGTATAEFSGTAPAEAGESSLTVLLALGANAGVGLLKLAAGLLTGSGALLSEAARSAGDCSTELLLLTALRRSDLKSAASRGRRSIRSYIRDPEDRTVKSVVLEDSAALIGLALAGAGVGLHQLTGSSFWDGAASLAIGALLVFAAFALAQTCKGLLIGKQADIRLVASISAWLEQQPEIVDVVDVLTMVTGVRRVLLCARVDVVDTGSAANLEHAFIRIDADLRAEFPSLDEIFIQPVPRSDALLRERVLSRYGRVLADEPDIESTARRRSAAAGLARGRNGLRPGQ